MCASYNVETSAILRATNQDMANREWRGGAKIDDGSSAFENRLAILVHVFLQRFDRIVVDPVSKYLIA